MPLRRATGCSLFALLLVAAFATVGCQRGPRNFENENDRLRAEVMKLQRQRDELQSTLDRRLGELQSLRQQLDRTAATQPMPGAEPPTLVSLQMGQYSGGVDTDDDGVDDLIRIYLRPLDQKGRLLPVAGRAHVKVVAIPDTGDPRLLAEQNYDPQSFENAWRSGFTGEHYTLQLPLPADLPADIQQVTVRVTFTQARTGIELDTQQPFRVRHE